jgi:hypothetical protein
MTGCRQGDVEMTLPETSRSNATGSRRTGLRCGVAALVAVGLLGLLAPACLDRPVAPQQPTTVKISTQEYRVQKVDKIDLLFMIDNSASMADKQEIMASAVPDLVTRLVNPLCVTPICQDPPGCSKTIDKPLPSDKQPKSTLEPCPKDADGKDTKREFGAIDDIHIGVITSSIGGHGADSCSNTPTAQYNERMEDMSHLVTRGAKGKVDTYQGKGFLWWDPTQKKASPPGTADPAALNAAFADIVRGTGQDGCGFEASLEAWYRFLVEPSPYQKMVVNSATGLAEAQGVDDTLLRQRQDFLRQDSLLAVIMLSDENDCSVVDGGQMYLALQGFSGQAAFHLPRATSACASDPMSNSCMSCGQPGAGADSACATPLLTDQEDALNLRCYRQRQRFGINFLWPLRRYIDGLTKSKIEDKGVNTGFEVGDVNPVYCTEYKQKVDPKDPNSKIPDRTECNKVMRDKNLVFLAGIVGVPWQDIAEDPADLSKGFRPTSELGWKKSEFDKAGEAVPNGVAGDTTLWDIIVGDPEKYKDPLDPLMVESVDPRTGSNPIIGAALASKDSKSPSENKINGHEWEIALRNDLQYACIFKLPKERNCVNNSASCDCSDNPPPKNPLCQKDDGTYDQIQRRAKAYPGLRQLAVVKGLADKGIVGSICPANSDAPDDQQGLPRADYGYRPAIAAIVDRLKSALQGKCWDQQLEPNASGEVPCVVLEGSKGNQQSDGTWKCDPCNPAEGRAEASQAAKEALSQFSTFKANNLHCICEIPQAKPGNEMGECVSKEIAPVGINGWCYIDPLLNKSANPTLTTQCPANAKRLIRFIGLGEPRQGSLTYLQCKGAAFVQQGGAAGSGGK